jgi:hypothetical protein
MGFLDKLLGRAKNTAADHADDVKGAVDKATDFVDDTTDKAVDAVAGKPAAPSDPPPAG